jgi:hypothetical protein
MGKEAISDGELVRNINVGRQAPEGQHARHHSRWREERGQCQRDVLVLATLLPHPRSCVKSYPDAHFL